MREQKNVFLTMCLGILLLGSPTISARADDSPIHLDALVEYQRNDGSYKATGPHPSQYGEVTQPYSIKDGGIFTLRIRYVGSLDGADIYLVQYSASRNGKVFIEEAEKAVIYRGDETALYRDDALTIKISNQSKED